MKRRDFLALTLAGAAAAFPHVAFAQQVAKVPRIAWLTIPLDPSFLQAMEQGLADNGYVIGKDVIVDVFTAPTNDELPAVASKIVAAKPDVIVTYGTAGALAVKAATATIPIVFLEISDPIGAGLVQSLDHPGGNVTGTTILGADLIGKQVAMLKELVPTLKRLAVPVFPADPITALYKPQLEAAAKVLDIEPVFFDFVQGQDYAPQFAPVFSAGAQAAFQPAYTEFNNFRDMLFDLYLTHRLPVLWTQSVLLGAATPFAGVAVYSADQLEQIRHGGASQVAALLRGAKPGDVPVQQAAVFDVGVNLDMPKKLGVTVPPSILAQTTFVIDYDIRAPKAAGK